MPWEQLVRPGNTWEGFLQEEAFEWDCEGRGLLWAANLY